MLFFQSLLATLFIKHSPGFLQPRSQTKKHFTPFITWKSELYFKKSGTDSVNNNVVPSSLYDQILPIASLLWDGEDIPSLDTKSNGEIQIQQGEAELPEGIDFSDRAHYFLQEANRGCPKAQHSIALLLWNEYAGVKRDEAASAKWHAAAAIQGHLDGMALFGGILRTGTGLKGIVSDKNRKQNISLGLSLIDYCAQMNNPTGVNKKAALFEIDEDYESAFHLYQACYDRGNTNALLKFNLGWCWINGYGVTKKDAVKGQGVWREAVEMAPDEGSEEAAWHLYEQCTRENPKVADSWLHIAIKLGYNE